MQREGGGEIYCVKKCEWAEIQGHAVDAAASAVGAGIYITANGRHATAGAARGQPSLRAVFSFPSSHETFRLLVAAAACEREDWFLSATFPFFFLTEATFLLKVRKKKLLTGYWG